jgi:hypothetical protein
MGHENRLVSSRHVVGGGERGWGEISQTAYIHLIDESFLCRDTVSIKLSECILLVSRCLHD